MRLTRKQLNMIIRENVDPTPETSLDNKQLKKLRKLLESEEPEDFRLAMHLATSLIEEDGKIHDGVVFGMVNNLAEKMNLEREQLQIDLNMLKRRRTQVNKESEKIWHYNKKLMALNSYKGIPPTEEYYENKTKFTDMLSQMYELGNVISIKEKRLKAIIEKYNIMSEFPTMLDYGDKGSVVIQDYVME